MKKYVVRLNDKYLTAYGSMTADIQCAEKFKEEEDALYAMADIAWGGSDEPPTIVEVEE